MFIVVLFTMIKIWKQPNYPSIYWDSLSHHVVFHPQKAKPGLLHLLVSEFPERESRTLNVISVLR